MEREVRSELASAKAITAAATAEGRGLTASEKKSLDGHLAAAKGLKGKLDATRIREGVGTGENAYATLAKAIVAGERSVEVSGFEIMSKAVSDADLGTDAQTGRAILERPGITGKLVDDRYIFGAFPREDAGSNLAVSEFRQTSEAIASGSVERALLATGEKAKLNVTIEHVSADIKQVAVLIEDIPNALLAAEGALQGFLSSRMNVALAEAIDAHVLAAIAASTPDATSEGSTIQESLRHAKADLREKGAHGSVAILTPEQAVEIDTTPAIDMPQAFPYGLGLRESKSATSALVIDPAVAGVLYLGSLKADLDPFTGFSTNTTTLRLEQSLLFFVRNGDAIQSVTPGS